MGLYVSVFGGNLCAEHARWAEFGSYFGGVLAPVYAMFAFLALLYTIYVQASNSQTEARRADLIRVLNSIDQELERILSERVSPAGKDPELNFYHVAHEAELQQCNPQKTGTYKQFLDVVGDQGTLLAASYHRLVARLTDLVAFIDEYEAGNLERSLLRTFYSGKFSFLLRMLRDERSAPEKVLEFLSPQRLKHY